MKMGNNNKLTIKLILSIIFLVAIYIFIAYQFNNFAYPNFDYIKFPALSMQWITEPEFQSFIWKLTLLFPATILLTLLVIKGNTTYKSLRKTPKTRIILLILLCSLILLIISSQFIFHETALTDDEYAYDFQANTLINGRIINPQPPVKENFSNVWLINDGHSWVGLYNLGHPIIIALGVLLGDRYIFTIILSILTLLLIYLITDRLFKDKDVAFLSVLLGAVSPFFYMISSSRLSHTTSAFFLALFMYLLIRLLTIENIKFRIMLSILAGLSLGYAFNTRPLAAVAFAFPFIILISNELWTNVKKTIVLIIGMLIGFAVIFLLTLWYNYYITGNPFQFPVQYYDPRYTMGFGPFGHTPLLGLKNFIVNFFRLNISLFGFPISLLFVGIIFFYTKDIRDYYLLSIIASFAVAYFFYYFVGVADLGPVYYYELIIPLLILTARGIRVSIQLISRFTVKGRSVVYTFLIISVTTAWLTYVPEKITHVSKLTAQIREPYEHVRSFKIHNAIVMIKRLPMKGFVYGYQNSSPNLTDDIIYCRFADKESNKALAKYFNNRNFYILDYDEKTEKSQLIWIDSSKF